MRETLDQTKSNAITKTNTLGTNNIVNAASERSLRNNVMYYKALLFAFVFTKTTISDVIEIDQTFKDFRVISQELKDKIALPLKYRMLEYHDLSPENIFRLPDEMLVKIHKIL